MKRFLQNGTMIQFLQKGVILLETKIGSDTDPFTILKKGNTITDDTNITKTVASGYRALLSIGIIGILVSLIIGAIILMYSRNPNNLEEAKKNLFVKIGIGILIFAFIFIVETVFDITSVFA